MRLIIIIFSLFYTSKLPVHSLNSNYLPSVYLFAYNCDLSWRLQYSDLRLSSLFLIKEHIRTSYSTFIILSTGNEELLPKYRTPSIFRKDLNCGRRGEMSWASRLSMPLKYCLMIFRSLGEATVFVVIVMPFQDSLMQLVLMVDL